MCRDEMHANSHKYACWSWLPSHLKWQVNKEEGVRLGLPPVKHLLPMSFCEKHLWTTENVCEPVLIQTCLPTELGRILKHQWPLTEWNWLTCEVNIPTLLKQPLLLCAATAGRCAAASRRVYMQVMQGRRRISVRGVRRYMAVWGTHVWRWLQLDGVVCDDHREVIACHFEVFAFAPIHLL